MSVAYDFAIIDAPVFEEQFTPRPVPSSTHAGLASVSVLHAPPEAQRPALRLTRRGQVVLALAVAFLGIGLVWAAAASAPSTARVARTPASVTVQSGDTLWSIASRIAPQADPRSEIALLQRRNHLSGVDLIPGQVLRVG